MDTAESPEVSIIIPSYKAKDYLKKCLNSIKEHMTGSYEVIVIEDCGEDGTLEMVEADYPWVTLLGNEENKGLIRTRLHGISKARGTYYFLIDSDIEMLPGAFEALKAEMDKDERLGFTTCNKQSFDGTHQRSCFALPTLWNSFIAMIPPLRHRQVLNSKERHDNINDPGWISPGHSLIRKAAWDDVGGQSEQFYFYGEEIDFSHKLHQNNWKIRFHPHMGFIHHGGVSQRGQEDKFRKLSWRGSILLADIYWPRWQGLVLRLLFFVRGLAVCLKKAVKGESVGDMFSFTLGPHCLVNTLASLDHDSMMEEYSSLAPGAHTGGQCKIGSHTAVGLGANIIHGIAVGEHSVIGAGSTVLKDVEAYKVAYGTPAKVVRDRKAGERYL